MGFNRFKGRGPYLAQTMPVSGYLCIRDNKGRIVLKPQSLAGESPLGLEELAYIAHLLNVHDLLNGAK